MNTPALADRRLRIGVSACFFHADPERAIFKGKTLLYAEESMLRWVMEAGALPLLLPRAAGQVTPADLLSEVDGLLLQGGSDVSPGQYGETPRRPQWQGDAPRDAYEAELIRACIAADKPVLGICRGLQILNVALGGSLYQDIAADLSEGRVHRDWDVYDQLFHAIEVEPSSWLAAQYPGQLAARVNSVHHQAIKALAPDLAAEAFSTEDRIIEAVRYTGTLPSGQTPFAYGVQWHPEFLDDTTAQSDPSILPRAPLMAAFLNEVRKRPSPTRA